MLIDVPQLSVSSLPQKRTDATSAVPLTVLNGKDLSDRHRLPQVYLISTPVTYSINIPAVTPVKTVNGIGCFTTLR